MNPPPFGDDEESIAPGPLDDEATDQALPAIASRLRQALQIQGVPPRQQAAWVARLCNLSVSQARRKLQGSGWLFDEVLTLAHHHGLSLDELARDDPAVSTQAAPLEKATVLLEGASTPCQVQIGHLLAPRDQDHAPVQAVRDGERWLVGAPMALRRLHPLAPRYAVQRLMLTPSAPRAPLRVAVIDDDLLAAESLCDWFDDAGGKAQAFASADALLGSDVQQFDAYVVDYILGAGQSSEALIRHLRHLRPQAPIVLLTGRLRDGTASEDSLTTLMRSLKVMFFEKPVRPAVLTAALLNSLDRSNGPTP
ncbi:MAG TPA: hypothetical protein H9903_17190 [Candidatus Aquabacterium excrementipullorum]|nr:hypothetical protein [Candidatus Aquabacterium excrementipullorum]